MPPEFSVQFDASLVEFALDEELFDYDKPWFFILRAAEEILGRRGNKEHRLVNLEVVPYLTEAEAPFGIAIVPYYQDAVSREILPPHPILLHTVISEGRCVLIDAFAESEKEVQVSSEMACHFTRMIRAYYEAVKSESVILPEERAG